MSIFTALTDFSLAAAGQDVDLNGVTSGEIATLQRFRVVALPQKLADLEAIKGIGRVNAIKLFNAGVETPVALVNSDTAVLSKRLGVKSTVIRRWQDEAAAPNHGGE
jgi:predicted flap endonuclease-1-like 5' DNA nuclease